MKKTVEKIAKQRNITINGDLPHDIQVKDERFYSEVAL